MKIKENLLETLKNYLNINIALNYRIQMLDILSSDIKFDDDDEL